jgi:hypothetical protein
LGEAREARREAQGVSSWTALCVTLRAGSREPDRQLRLIVHSSNGYWLAWQSLKNLTRLCEMSSAGRKCLHRNRLIRHRSTNGDNSGKSCLAPPGAVF